MELDILISSEHYHQQLPVSCLHNSVARNTLSQETQGRRGCLETLCGIRLTLFNANAICSKAASTSPSYFYVKQKKFRNQANSKSSSEAPQKPLQSPSHSIHEDIASSSSKIPSQIQPLHSPNLEMQRAPVWCRLSRPQTANAGPSPQCSHLSPKWALTKCQKDSHQRK